MDHTVFEIALGKDTFSDSLNEFILSRFYIKVNLKQLSVLSATMGVTDEQDLNDNRGDWFSVHTVYMDITDGTISAYILKGINADDKEFYITVIHNAATGQFWFNRYGDNLSYCKDNFRFEYEEMYEDLYSYIRDFKYPYPKLEYFIKTYGSSSYMRIPFEDIDPDEQEFYKMHLASRLPLSGTKLSSKITIDEVILDVTEDIPEVHQYNYTNGIVKTYTIVDRNKFKVEPGMSKMDINAHPLITYLMEYAFNVLEDEFTGELDEIRRKEQEAEELRRERALAAEMTSISNEIEQKTQVRFKEDSYIGTCKGLEDFEIVLICEDCVQILKSLKDKEDYETFSLKDREGIIKFLKNTLKTETERTAKICAEVGRYEGYTISGLIKDKKQMGKLYDEYDRLSDVERQNVALEQAMDKLDALFDRTGKISQDHIELYLQSIKNFESKLDRDSKENVFDHEEELTQDEKELVKKEMDEFYAFLDGLEDETTLELSEYRRVFIKKSLQKQYRGFTKDIRLEINRIVQNMKTMGGKELLSYLRKDLRMNDPYRSMNHKVRIKNLSHLPYRMCFWQGKDFTDRRETRDDIYIYMFVTDHDKDIEKMNDIKPSKYVENDFDLFTLDIDEDSDSVRLPELREQQLRIASYTEGPVVVYGCAGSGKTLISIDQYWQLVTQTKQYDDSYIAYVTFQGLLRDKAKECIESYGIKSYCYTLPDFFRFVTAGDAHKAADEMDFIRWYRDYYVTNGNVFGHKKDITHIFDKPSVERIIYTYYRGIYKGSDKLWNSNPEYSHSLTDMQFKSEMTSRETFLHEGEIEDILTVCKKYHAFCLENDLYDDNDWSIEVLKALNLHKLHRVQNIVIDEVQDLTGLQLRAIISSLKAESLNIFFYGDPHQIVNPTIFDDSVLRTALKEILGQDTKIDEPLGLNILYRTNEYLKNYLASLQGKRLSWIGNYMENVARVVSTREETKVSDEIYDIDNDQKITSDDRWASYLTDEKLIGETLQKAVLSNASIIVPDDATKTDIISHYPKISKNRIFTIYESKGMEWNKVVLYDIISSAKDYFMDMIHGNAKKSTVCRMFFNKFYVGCTRARDTFIVIENDITEEITTNLLEKLPKIEDESQIGLYLDGKATCPEWIQETKRFIENKDYARASYPLLMARKTAKSKEERIQVQKLKRRLQRINGESGELLSYGDEAYDEGSYQEAMEFYLTIGKKDMVTLCRIMLDLKIEKKEYMVSLIESGLLDSHPEALKHMDKQPIVLEMILNTYNRLYGGKEE